MAECLTVILFSLNSLLCCDAFNTIAFTDTAIPVSLILKIKESKRSVYGERNDVTPSPNDLACWLLLLFIFSACFFQLRICLWEMFIDFNASHRDKPSLTFRQATRKYISFSCRVNLLLFFMPPLHPSSVCCAPKSSSFSACSSLSLSSSSELTALFSSSELTASFSSSELTASFSSSPPDSFSSSSPSALPCPCSPQ